MSEVRKLSKDVESHVSNTLLLLTSYKTYILIFISISTIFSVEKFISTSLYFLYLRSYILLILINHNNNVLLYYIKFLIIVMRKIANQ